MIPRIKNDFIRPSGTGESWTLNIKPLSSKFDNYFIESCRAAEEIYALKEGPLHLMYSGGLDSEYALSVFLHMGINITPVIVRLQPNYNDHDTEYAFKFCQQKNIKPLVIDIDFNNFIESGKFDEINQIIKSGIWARATTCYALDKIDGSVICGEGDPHTVKDEKTSEWYFSEVEHSYTLENYMEYKNIDGTAFFCGYTSEMFTSFLMDPRMLELADNKIFGKLGSKSSKSIVYNRHTPFILIDRPKYHGFETIMQTNIINHPDWVKLTDKNPEIKFDGHFHTKYHDLIKDLV